MTDEEHTTAPTKSPIQLLKTQSTSLEEDKLLYIHHMLCNLILLSYSLHANQEEPRSPSKLLQKIEELSAKVSNNSLWNSFSYIYINIGEVALTLR